MVGRTISHYTILAKLGEGGMGVVYKAEDVKLGRLVALKFLASHLLRDEDARKRFEREARAAAALDHPNICTVHEIDQVDGQTFIALAFLDGQTLSAKIAEGPLKILEALSVAIQLAEGLAAAHELGVVHRDMKPDNVMLLKGSRGVAKIMDFGLAQLAGTSKLTKHGTTLGTMWYMSPEQAEGAATDQRTDLWSLGVMLYEMVAGQAPFRGDFDQAVVYSIVNEAPEPLTAVRTGVPKELERIVGKCLAKDAASRYQNAEDLLVDLNNLSQELKLSGSRTAQPDHGAVGPSREGAPLVKYAAAAIGALALAALVWVLRPAAPPPAAPSEALRAVPFTTYPGSERSPSFSPDGEQAAFSWDGPGRNNFDIYIKSLGEDEPRRLSSDSRMDVGPAWSPDGRSIAWLRGVSDFAEVAEVVQAPVVGGAERVWGKTARAGAATSLYFSDTRLVWTPDGKGVVVQDRDSESGQATLVVLSPDGSKRRLTSPPTPFIDIGPAFSPDGRTLAFIRVHGLARRDVYVVDLADDLSPLGEPRRLTHDRDLASGLSWTADGRSLVYSAGSSTQAELWRLPVINADASRERLGLSSRPWGATAIAALGGRLAFVRDAFEVNIFGWASRDGQLLSASPRRIIASSGRDFNPQFSPDGARIAFASSRSGGEVGVFTADADGSNIERLYVDPEAHSGTPRWSPDGQRIAFDSNPGGDVNVFVISVNGGNALQLTSDPAQDAIPSWSHDGEWVYFSSIRTGRAEIWKKRVGDESAVQATTNGGLVAFESPDGQNLYYLKANSGPLYRMLVQGGEEEQVVDSVFFRNLAVTENGVYFISELTGVAQPRYRIGKYDPMKGAVETVVLLPEGVRPHNGFSVSQAADAIAYSQVDRRESDLMLVEDFR